MMPYTVTDTQQIRQMTRGGTLQTVYRVSITTDRNASGDIDIAERDWNPEKLAELLGSFADRLDMAFIINE